MDKTREMIGTALFRKMKFESKFQELLTMVKATDFSYVELVLDDEGRFSKKKTDLLIDELLKCLVELRAYWNISKEFTGGKMRYKELEKKEVAFYKSYLYLLLGLGMYSGNYQWCSGGDYVGGTWDALCDPYLIKCPYEKMAELDRDLINTCSIDIGLAEFRSPKSIFYRLTAAYEYIIGSEITDILSKKEYQNGYDLLSDHEKELLDDPEYYDNQKELDRHHFEEVQDIEFDDDEEFLEMEYSEKELQHIMEETAIEIGNQDDESEENKEKWIQFFEDTKRFKNCCKTVHKGLFDPEVHGNLEEEIPAVVEIFLSKRGYAVWLDDDKFFSVYTYLNKVCLITEKLLGGK